MVFDKTEEARLAMEKSAPVSYQAGGHRYIGNLTREREDGKFHFRGIREGKLSEELAGWDDPHRFSVIE